jgi:hypothetical protein
MYIKYVPTEKLVLGIPAFNFPLMLADEKNTGLKSKINRKNPNSELFKDLKAVSKNTLLKLPNLLVSSPCSVILKSE